MATLDFIPYSALRLALTAFRACSPTLWNAMKADIRPTTSRRADKTSYRIVLALAAFSKDDVEVIVEHNRLCVRGKLKDLAGPTYLHRGIASRGFERQFDLADYIEVTGATIGDGLLVIDLKRELPEALKPRSIPINAGTFVPLGRKPTGTIEHQANEHLAGLT